MNNKPFLPPPSADWGRSMSELVDDVSDNIESLSQDVDVRFRGADAMARSLIGQTGMIQSAIDNSQPIFIQSTTVNGLIVGPDPAPVTKATVVLNTPPGYTSVMLQAYGSAYVRNVSAESPGSMYPIESQIRVESNGIQDGPLEVSPSQEVSGARSFIARATYYIFRPNIGSTVSIQLRMRNPGTAVYNNGANAANLSVLANFYKGEVLLPPA